MAGMALLTYSGRGAAWSIMHVVRAPISSAIIVTMTLGSGLAASNALYMQEERHPAPFFADDTIETSSVSPVKKPIVRTSSRPVAPVRVVKKSVPITTPVVRVAPPAPTPVMPEAVAKIGHSDVVALQKKLKTLGFFKGEADGYYGPQTANAIRAFEASRDLSLLGALTPSVIAAVQNAKPLVPAAKPTKRVLPSVEKVPLVTSAIPKKITTDLTKSKLPVTKPIVSDSLTKIVKNVATIAQQAQKKMKPPASALSSDTIRQVQRGLAKLGFLSEKIDGVAGDATAKAVRKFEVYFNYDVTGTVTPELVDLLDEALG